MMEIVRMMQCLERTGMVLVLVIIGVLLGADALGWRWGWLVLLVGLLPLAMQRLSRGERVINESIDTLYQLLGGDSSNRENSSDPVGRLRDVLEEKVGAAEQMSVLARDLMMTTGTLVSGFTEALATADSQSALAESTGKATLSVTEIIARIGESIDRLNTGLEQTLKGTCKAQVRCWRTPMRWPSWPASWIARCTHVTRGCAR